MAPSTSPANNPAGWECGWPPSHRWLLAFSFWWGKGERGNWMWEQKLLPFMNRKEKRKAGRERMLSRPGWGDGRGSYTQTRVGAVQRAQGAQGAQGHAPAPPPHTHHQFPASPLSSSMSPQPVTQQSLRFWNSVEEARIQTGWMYLL